MKKVTLLILILVAFSCSPKEPVEEVGIITTSFGAIVVEFFPLIAPYHVDSFITNAKRGYFDGTTFHRVIPGFVIQGGDPNSKDDDRSNDGWGGAAARYYEVGDESDSTTWGIPAEFSDRPHLRGILSMARSRDINSGGSQFFICIDEVPRLDTKYSVFGRVISGMEVADKIVSVPRDEADNPLEKVDMSVKIIERRRWEKINDIHR